MRSSAVAIAALLLAACGGDYSNADIEFAAAIPRRSDVTVNVPRSTALTAEEGPSKMVYGGASKAASDTHAAAKFLDDLTGFVVGFLEQVIKIDPTVRTPELRIWGPFTPDDLPDWELQLLITRRPVQIDVGDPRGPIEGFGWAIQYKPRGAQAWNEPALVEGFYEPGEIRHGLGLVVAHLAEARAAGLPLGTTSPDLETLALRYDTRTGQPHTIDLGATNTAGVRAGVRYVALDGGAGSMVFDVYQQDWRADHILAATRWTAEGAGRGDVVVISGFAAGSRAVECWDAGQTVVFVDNPWESDFGGDQTLCAFPP